MICTKCKVNRPLDRFAFKGRDRSKGRRQPCKDCLNARNRLPKYRAHKTAYLRRKRTEDPGAWSAVKHGRWLKTFYNVTAEWYAAKLAEQNGACALCHQEDPLGRLSVDHDHRCCPGVKSCGRCVRDLLCRACNRGLGGFNDDSILIRAGADYVDRWRDKIAITEIAA
jgi:hypothetical protein